MTNMHRILLATALCQGLSACQMAGETVPSYNAPHHTHPEKWNGICPDLSGTYEATTLSAENDNYLRKPIRGWLSGVLLAGFVAPEKRYVNKNGQKLFRNFDYVHLHQNSDKSIKITVGYADEDQPKGSKEVPLNDEKRRCEGNFIETFTKKKGGGEGFSSTINIQTTIRKDQDGSIVAIETWTQSKTVASIPIGSDTQTFTYRFKPWVPRHQ